MKKTISLILALMLVMSLLCTGALASGEASGNVSAEVTSNSTDTNTVLPESVEMDELIISADGYCLTNGVLFISVSVFFSFYPQHTLFPVPGSSGYVREYDTNPS